MVVSNESVKTTNRRGLALAALAEGPRLACLSWGRKVARMQVEHARREKLEVYRAFILNWFKDE